MCIFYLLLNATCRLVYIGLHGPVYIQDQSRPSSRPSSRAAINKPEANSLQQGEEERKVQQERKEEQRKEEER